MSIEQLRRDLLALQDELPSISYGDLGNGAAAAVYPDGGIVISTKLTGKEKIEAEAHELMHILLNKQGLLMVVSEYEGESEFLALEINNAISHWFLINGLKNDYKIESELHLSERAASLSTISNDIEELYFDNSTTLLKGLGVRLYDIARTIPAIEREVIDIATTNQLVNHVFQMARKILSRITIESSKEMQLETIAEFLLEIDENPSSFSFR
ncbi:hypothetical protein M3568_02655 [Priestia flexa]|uniref:hypothetical protein n=1 Tax=Priestia flexa TaxID=86664 RepID=UPI002041B0DC|nr:hypothetical protein [Priestia flexa]MCM3065330.1 hypothetical protein [Priestia flexa]